MGMPTMRSNMQAEYTIREMDTWVAQQPSKFAYQITIPEGEAAEKEHDEIIEELLVGDVYRLASFTKPGDVWVDAGSHVGTFAVAAQMQGAYVYAMIDMDPSMAFHARRNGCAFSWELHARDNSWNARPLSVVEEIKDSYILADLGSARSEWPKDAKRSCLKMDIQGAERDVLKGGGAKHLAAAFDVLVMEWHHLLAEGLEMLEQGGWRVERVEKHVDVLLNTDTHIIWAVNG